uniref:kelch-like protein 40a n=1 Tax=Styela clava TaxID=7725 RepID=UPI001939CB90|nr:kelch-like protein 40a [Styela clava]
MDHLEKLSSALDDLRKNETACDFMIKVGEELFPVHRNVLIAASDYFRAMLSHDTKERQEGVVDMKEVEPDAVKLCIEFMYTGATTVTMEVVENVLPAAGIMQLNALSENCVEVLEENVKAENCISVLKLARTHSFTDLEENALELFRENYNFEEFGDFVELEKEGLVERISDFSLRNELAWEVIINWIKLNVEERSKDILEFIKLLDWDPSPSTLLLEKLQAEPVFIENQKCKDFLMIQLFSNLSLSRETFMEIFRTSHPNCFCDESARWDALMTWIKHDNERKTLLPKLVEYIRFDRLSDDFLKNKINNESLLSEYPECYKTIFEALHVRSSMDKNYIAVLYPGGKIYTINFADRSWRKLPDLPSEGIIDGLFTIHNKLCVLLGCILLYLSENGSEWLKRRIMKESPDDETCAKIVTYGNCVYVVKNEMLGCYDSSNNEWKESFPGCGFDQFYAAMNKDGIFASGTNESSKYFSLSSNSWGNVNRASKKSQNFSVAQLKGDIYAIGSFTPDKKKHYRVLRYKGNEWWKTGDFPVDVATKSFAFTVNDRLFVLLSGSFYIYDELGDSWGVLCKLPIYSKGGLISSDKTSQL